MSFTTLCEITVNIYRYSHKKHSAMSHRQRSRLNELSIPVDFKLIMSYYLHHRPCINRSLIHQTPHNIQIVLFCFVLLWQYQWLKLGHFAMPDTCERWPGIVNRYVYYGRQTWEIYQVLLTQWISKLPGSFEIHCLRPNLINVVLVWIKDMQT